MITLGTASPSLTHFSERCFIYHGVLAWPSIDLNQGGFVDQSDDVAEGLTRCAIRVQVA
jgi:hypothetical protein